MNRGEDQSSFLGTSPKAHDLLLEQSGAWPGSYTFIQLERPEYLQRAAWIFLCELGAFSQCLTGQLVMIIALVSL